MIGRTAIVGLIGIAAASAGCARIDLDDVKMPKVDPNIFSLTSPSIYRTNTIGGRKYGPEDLIDAEGRCPGVANAAAPAVDASLEPALGNAPPPPRGVALGMSECEVARALGQPQSVEIGAESGGRSVVMTFMAGERAGIYRFTGGRLVSVERGPEPPPPPKPERPVRGKPPQKRPPNA